jgi:redox-sensitive bicupin YhaK (pirin superfamily)
MHGFQLSASLPAKPEDADPRYQEIPARPIPKSPMTTKPESG